MKSFSKTKSLILVLCIIISLHTSCQLFADSEPDNNGMERHGSAMQYQETPPPDPNTVAAAVTIPLVDSGNETNDTSVFLIPSLSRN
jgi:hypothetical protein